MPSDRVLYRIRDWEQHYETAETRKIKRLDWVKLSNKLNGDCYLALLHEHPNGPLHWAAWCAILQVASLSKKRGTLIQDSGDPHTAASLARKTSLPEAWFQEALPRLASTSVCWLEAKHVEDKELNTEHREFQEKLGASSGSSPEVPGKSQEQYQKRISLLTTKDDEMPPGNSPEENPEKIRAVPDSSTHDLSARIREDLIDYSRVSPGLQPTVPPDAIVERVVELVRGACNGKISSPADAFNRLMQSKLEQGFRPKKWPWFVMVTKNAIKEGELGIKAS
jgi:hypothetical protein